MLNTDYSGNVLEVEFSFKICFKLFLDYFFSDKRIGNVQLLLDAVL